MKLKISLAQWIELVGMFGLLISLVMVGYQLKQNTDMQRIDLLMQETSAIIDNERLMIENEHVARVWAKSLEDPTSLTLAEQRIMEGYLWIFVELLRSNHRMKEHGLLSDEDWKYRLNTDAGFYLGNPYAWGWFLGFVDGNLSLPKEITDHIFYLKEHRSLMQIDSTLRYMNDNQEFIKQVLEETQNEDDNSQD